MAVKEKLQEYALIAEIISAVAIVASLIFVAVELRSNTNATYQNSYDELLSSLSEHRRAMFINSEFFELNYEIINSLLNNPGNALLEFEPVELERFLLEREAMWQIWERAYFAYTLERLDVDAWNRFQNNICQPGNIPFIQLGESDESSFFYFKKLSFSDKFWEYAKECINNSIDSSQ